MIVAGILALAFMGFTGVDRGMENALTPSTETETQVSIDEGAHLPTPLHYSPSPEDSEKSDENGGVS